MDGSGNVVLPVHQNQSVIVVAVLLVLAPDPLTKGATLAHQPWVVDLAWISVGQR